MFIRAELPLPESDQSPIAEIFEAMPVAIALTNSDGIIELVNSALERMFCAPRSELLGASVESLIPALRGIDHRNLVTQYLERPTHPIAGAGRELHGLRRSGTEFPIEIGLSAIETEKGPQSLVTVIDISHLKQAEMALRRANTNLEEFTSVASHDLRSPLRAMSDLLGWIEESIAADDLAAARNNIARARLRTALLERIVEDLLTFARAGIASPDNTLIRVRDLIAQTVEVQHVPPGFIIQVDCPDLSIIAPRTPLETALRNLVANAIKHRARDDGRVDINVAEKDAFIVFTVADDGPGIPDAARTRIFKLFQTAASTNGGSGIGLAVSKRMVEGHGGEIELVGDDNSLGATFRLWWPRFVRRTDDAPRSAEHPFGR